MQNTNCPFVENDQQVLFTTAISLDQFIAYTYCLQQCSLETHISHKYNVSAYGCCVGRFRHD